jgi:hypothetical protein
LLKNPWNLTSDQKERLSTLVRWNTPIVRAYYDSVDSGEAGGILFAITGNVVRECKWTNQNPRLRDAKAPRAPNWRNRK